MLALVASLMGCPPPVLVEETGVFCECIDPNAASDGDGDGYLVQEADCDDADPSVNPGAEEPCDGIDNNCDGLVDEFGPFAYVDVDGDGFGRPGSELIACDLPEGYSDHGGDCDDADPSVNTGAEEVCDGKDNDCDRWIDEVLGCGG